MFFREERAKTAGFLHPAVFSALESRLAVVVLVLILIVLILVLILVAVLILVVVLVLITVFHGWNPPAFLFCGLTAQVVCPDVCYLSFGLKISAIRQANTTAAAIPPAVAFRPPVRIPIQPSD